MIKTRLALLLGGMTLATSPALAQTAPMTSVSAAAQNDPYIWLEDKDGAKPLAWVEAENARTLPRLQNDPRYRPFYDQAFAIASAQDRVPLPQQVGGRVLNFWRDEAHPHGVWRWTTGADYATPDPRWTTLLDIDALGKAEGKSWVWKGFTCLEPEERLCLVALSEGGEDAVAYREFDLSTGRFVPHGFALPKSKQDVTWVDENTLLVSRDWGPGTSTGSGYPFVVKRVTRGQPLDAAVELYRGAATDQVSTASYELRDGDGRRAIFFRRGVTFFGAETAILTPQGPKKLDLPPRADAVALIDGQVIFRTSDPWGSVPAGAVASAPLAEVEQGTLRPRVVFTPNARQSVESVAATKSTLLVSINDNVRGRILAFRPQGGALVGRQLALPDNANVGVVDTSPHNDHAFLGVTDFLTPFTLYAADVAESAAPAVIKRSPPKFDASRDVVDQYEATSTDGTRIPYFVVHRRELPLNGSTPTIMTAYGGFEVSMTPYYSGGTGKLWLERGGSFVLANIRGGGEFGPAWHDAGRKTKRQIIYDDFAAVAKDLEARRLTSPAKLGIYGGSNGGLLMGVEFNQHPDLWRAVVIQVPLLDMMRYEQIEAGASWVDEYGSVKNPDEAAFLRTISPYQNLKRGVAYPEPFIWTTTKDDRVGPQHARKFAARMKEYGLPYLFYEDTAGGHSGDADIAQGARLQALQMVYFSQKLMDPAETAAK